MKYMEIGVKKKLNQPTQSRYQPKSKYISQPHRDISQNQSISAKIKIYQPTQSRYQPKSK
ncbi:hypothetical protein KGR20_08775 [Cytobacillus oceanisediminis]|uniref:hypothetical protein n=1 Tax=Bacillaceae TaxID=186817 RepID=UPI001CCE2C20|nr:MULTISPECIES: hypothetical protein [Bacillaceae]MBZ9534350.1 hypothetical protein [Cytobacillus oceanisediminis]UTI42601.1 hypothetical protein NKG37_02240 [Niallia sp. RD1]